MVCVPCIFIPVLLWVFHKWIQPFIMKFWNPWSKTIDQQTDGTGPPKGVEETDKIYQYIQQEIKEHPVMLFSKTTCSFCKMAKEVLDGTGVNYAVEEIGEREDMKDLQDMFAKMTGARTVPRVFVGGKCIGGGSEAWSIHNQDKLVPMMKEAGATFKKTD